MINPLGWRAITQTNALLNPKLHKIRVPEFQNRKLFLIQMTRPFCQPSPDSRISKRHLGDDYKGMLIS